MTKALEIFKGESTYVKLPPSYRCPKCGLIGILGSSGICKKEDLVAVLAGQCNRVRYVIDCGDSKCGFRTEEFDSYVEMEEKFKEFEVEE